MEMEPFKAADLVITKAEKLSEIPDDLPFGVFFSDHMLVIEYDAEKGWGIPEIKPLGHLSIHPAAGGIQYGLGCIEGMKAFRGVDGAIRLFRPMENMKRFNISSGRLTLPGVDPQEFMKCIKELVKVDQHCIPEGEGMALYLRPFATATDPGIPLCTPRKTLICVVGCPSKPFFGQNAPPAKLYLDEVNVRAWPGGVGNYKVCGNYGPTLIPQVEATRNGCGMVLFCFPRGPEADDAVIAEGAGLNIFFLVKRDDAPMMLVTPPLDGTILPGITRKSIIELSKGFDDVEVLEREVSIRELTKWSEEGTLLEVFGAGTAVSVAPIVCLQRANGKEIICTRSSGAMEYSSKLRSMILDIQVGRQPHEWAELV